ncbi:MAG: VTT domain-containing protein [Bdellovibrionota bacterium]
MLTLCLSLFLGSFISEDGSLLTALALAKDAKLPLLIACLASGLGIFVGDLGLYLIGRSAQSWPFAAKYTQKILSSHFFRPGYADSKWGYGAVFIARFVPGTRLPIYLIAGVCKMSFWDFFWTTAIAVLIWTTLITTASAFIFQFLNPSQTWMLVCGIIAFIFAVLFLSQKENFQVKLYRLQKLKHFEFWPMWIFYWPVVIYYLLQSLKYRSLKLPLYANPGISNSGVVGESKAELLQHLNSNSAHTLKHSLIDLEKLSPEQASTELNSFLKNEELEFPIIIKPDVGQRGSGVRVVHSFAEAKEYFAHCKAQLLIQEYCTYTEELGVNYVRYPGEENGRITGITENASHTL